MIFGDMTSATDVAREISKHTETRILEQLNDFIKRGLIEVESGPVTFVQEESVHGDYKVRILQSVNLRLKDREYIEKLQKENAELKHQLGVFRDFVLKHPVFGGDL